MTVVRAYARRDDGCAKLSPVSSTGQALRGNDRAVAVDPSYWRGLIPIRRDAAI